MVVAVAVAVAVAGAVENPIHPQLIKFVPKYTDFGSFKSNLVAPPCLTPARKAFQGGDYLLTGGGGYSTGIPQVPRQRRDPGLPCKQLDGF